MSAQTVTGVTVHQNITLKMSTSNDSPSKRNSSNRKRRATSSMIYLDEEPVFSDSEEEKEYMRQVFGKTNHVSPPKSPKNREVEIQCDIISNEKTLIALIKKCSLLNPDVTTRFSVFSDVTNRFSVANKYLRELVCLCKQIQSEMHEQAADLSDGSCNEEELFEDQFTKNNQTTVASTPVYASSEEFLPSSCGTYPQDGERLSRSLTENEIIPSEPFVCDEQSPSTDKRKMFKKRRTKTKNNSEKGLMRHSIRERRPPKQRYNNSGSFLNKRQFLENEKENIKKKLTGGLRKKLKNNILSKHSDVKQRIGRGTDKSYQDMPKPRHSDLENISSSPESLNSHENAKQLMNMEAPLNISIPKKILKSLARNWMKPNKSFCLEETSRPQLHYASLQHEKKRRLYSPSRWLESDDFLNSMPQPHEK